PASTEAIAPQVPIRPRKRLLIRIRPQLRVYVGEWRLGRQSIVPFRQRLCTNRRCTPPLARMSSVLGKQRMAIASASGEVAPRLRLGPPTRATRRFSGLEMNAWHRLIAWLRYEWQWQVSYYRDGVIPLPPGYHVVPRHTGRTGAAPAGVLCLR